MSQPTQIGEIFIQIAADPNDPTGNTLRQLPSIQAELLRRKIISLDDLTVISLDDLTDEQISRLIEWDQQQNPKQK